MQHARPLQNSAHMQVQCQSHIGKAVPTISNIANVRVCATSGRSRALSSRSAGFAAGRAVDARPARRALSRSRPQAAQADVFFTQKTVPDQTGRVAIVTGTPGTRETDKRWRGHLIGSVKICIALRRQFVWNGVRSCQMLISEKCHSHHSSSKQTEV